MLIDLQSFDTWKIQLTSAINFISLKDVEEERVFHSKSEYIKITFYIDKKTNSLIHFVQDIKAI